MGIRDVLSANLQSIRRSRGITQEALAHAADLDRTYVSAIERRVYGITIDVLERLAIALDVEPADLLKKQAGATRYR